MTALTGQEVVSQMASKLRRRFSEEEFAEIYKDKPVQSMKTPCIFLHEVETTHTPELRNFAWWDHIIDVRCHPKKMRTDIYTWARSVAPMIVDCVHNLTISDQQVKARGATWRVEDNVLHVVVTYRYRVIRTVEDIPDMQTLTYGERVK